MAGLLHRLITRPSPALERDEVTLSLDNGELITVQRVRHPCARRIKLSVDERGARLTLPLRASLVAGERFLLEHRDWLSTQLHKYANKEAAPALQRGQTTELPLRGQSLPLHWQSGRYARIELNEDGVHFQLPAKASDALMHRSLRAFYEAQARADLGRWMPRYLPSLPRAPSRFRLKIMSSQWGSLSPDGSLALDLSLVIARPSAFEYVLVHELCHLIQANHSAAFWHEVEQRFPHWQDERDYFHAQGRQLKASLRALVSA